jgi:hypothetical protein
MGVPRPAPVPPGDHGARRRATGGDRPGAPISRGVRAQEFAPAVASDGAGNFVVVSTGRPVQPAPRFVDVTLPSSIFARRYDRAGAPQGDEFVLNLDASVHPCPRRWP